MPAADFAKILGTVFSRVEEHAKENEAKQQKEKDADIQMYRKVLLDPDSSPEQRQKAASQIDKLRGMKGKESPFQKLAGMLNHVKSKQPQAGASPEGGGPAQPPPAPQATGQGGVAEGAAPQLSPGQKAVGEKALEKKSRGLGSVLTGVGDFLNPEPRPLPPIDGSVAPTAEQLRTSKVADINAELGAREPFIEKQIKLRGEEAQKTAAARVKNAQAAKQKYPGSAFINSLPEDLRSKMVDANGLPVDPNGLYGPIAGEEFGLDQDAEGRPVLTGVRVGSGAARTGESEQIIYDPDTHAFKTFAVRRDSNSPEPPKRQGGPAPGLKTRDAKDLPGAGTFKASGGRSTGGRTVPGIPIRSFGQLQKQSNPIEEARNSLVGDDPLQVGGIAADLDVFKNPESVKRLSNYIGYVNKQMEESSHAATGSGPVAAAEWYGGLPVTVSNLQQSQLRDLSKTLDGGAEDGPEHRFVADYYRALGTIGGLRAATGGSAAKWSFKNLQSEFVTPGSVTTYDEAARRIRNLVSETNVVAKHNPMVKKIDTKTLPGGQDRPYSGPRATLNGKGLIVEGGKWVFEDTHQPVPMQ